SAMAKEVITTDQLKYFRLVAAKDRDSGERWKDAFNWYAVRQNIDFGRVAQIYCDCYHRYGIEFFKKYAQLHRLNKKHSYTYDDIKKTLEEAKEVEAFGASNGNFAKVPPTEYGEYGRVKPNRIQYC
ncbi:hypothetical protein KR222_004985, partial [Zaprionus bogoriensis]